MKRKETQNKLLISTFIIAITIAFILPGSATYIEDNNNGIKQLSDTITVDDDGGGDYTKIQDAINASTDGDTIFVYNGMYFENLTIDKEISLVGESKTGTIIKVNKTILGGQMFPRIPIINVSVDNVVINSFTIYSCGEAGGFVVPAGILLEDVSNCEVNNTILEYTELGAFMTHGIKIYGKTIETSNNAILNTELYGDTYCDSGIVISNSIENTLINCIISKNKNGIMLHASSNKVIGCEIYDATQSALTIPLSDATANKIVNCYIHDNSYGVYVSGRNNIIHHNHFENQTNLYYGNAYAQARNIWDDGYEGNYWDDYTGSDANGDGVGDTPYLINVSNQDRHPLMSWRPAPPQITVIYPNEVEDILGGEIEILWADVLDVMDVPIEGATISIDYNINGGEWQPIDSGLEDTGSYLWNTIDFPQLIDSNKYLIRVGASYDEKTGYDASDDEFTLDATDPMVNITRPLQGDILLLNNMLVNLGFLQRAIVIGQVTVIAPAEDELSGVDYVHFELDSGESFDDDEPPYSWTLNEPIIGARTLTVTAFDNVGRSSPEPRASVDMFIINPFGGTR